MLRNMGARLKFIQQLFSASVSASVNSTGVDCESFGSMLFLLSVGTFAFTGSNKITVKMQYSDDNSTWADVPVAEMYPDKNEGGVAGVLQILDATGEDAQAYFYEYRGSKRYARLALVVAGTVAAPIAVTSMGSYAELMPPL